MKIDDLVAEFTSRVVELEVLVDKSDLATKTARRAQSVASLMADFPDIDVSGINTAISQLESKVVRPEPFDKEVCDRIRNAISSREDIGWLEADAVEAGLVCDRYDNLFSTKTKASTSLQSLRGGTRSIGVPIRATCKCGWETETEIGDWTSIRWRIRAHATSCDQANPGRIDSLVNDLDRVREAVVIRRETSVTGGVTVEVG